MKRKSKVIWNLGAAMVGGPVICIAAVMALGSIGWIGHFPIEIFYVRLFGSWLSIYLLAWLARKYWLAPRSSMIWFIVGGALSTFVAMAPTMLGDAVFFSLGSFFVSFPALIAYIRTAGEIEE